MLRYLYFLLIVRPVVLVVIGLNVRRQELLPQKGPAIVIANHNSHLDAMVLMTLFGLGRLKDVHAVAAADHFFKSRWMAWFSTHVLGVIPIEREIKSVRVDPLAGICEALDKGKTLILFPEGTRGDPEVREEFKTGVAHVAKRYPELPVTPVFLHGLGRSLPKGEGVLVPFFCDVFIGEPIHWTGNKSSFMEAIGGAMNSLEAEKEIPRWESV